MAKIIKFSLKKAFESLKQFNEIISNQKTALTAWKNLRVSSLSTGKAHYLPVIRKTIGLPKDVTGGSGKKFLNALRKQRKQAAKVVRHLEEHKIYKAKWSGGDTLKRLNDGAKNHQKLYEKMSAVNQHDIASRHHETMTMAKKAKDRLLDRQINARGKGVRFVRINGRIVPIRGKK